MNHVSICLYTSLLLVLKDKRGDCPVNKAEISEVTMGDIMVAMSVYIIYCKCIMCV